MCEHGLALARGQGSRHYASVKAPAPAFVPIKAPCDAVTPALLMSAFRGPAVSARSAARCRNAPRLSVFVRSTIPAHLPRSVRNEYLNIPQILPCPRGIIFLGDTSSFPQTSTLRSGRSSSSSSSSTLRARCSFAVLRLSEHQRKNPYVSPYTAPWTTRELCAALRETFRGRDHNLENYLQNFHTAVTLSNI
jgi:hypothetical protein